MDYEQLKKAYEKVLEENQRLKEEIKTLKKQSVDTENVESSVEEEVLVRLTDCLDSSKNHSPVTQYSPPAEKIDLFMVFFNGRKDVYAKRWENRKGYAGYSPACVNEWVAGVCRKPEIKCSKCDYRVFSKFDEAVVERHLRGHEVIGVYPMLQDESCWFLAIDFDDEGWQEDIKILRNICNEQGIPIAVERSRSGEGGHAWFFFSEKIAAVQARKFGTAMLTYAMSKRHEIKFKSYDRLFPNQDTMPKGGFGNLIAVPLQMKARSLGNSVFVDQEFMPYDDQWEYMNSLKRLSEEDLAGFIANLSTGDELGNLRTDSGSIKPWEKSRGQAKLAKADFPSTVKITKANMLYVEKVGLSEKAMNVLKRMAAFKNPEFYKAQAMRLPTFDKPRIINLSDETEHYLCLPRGCEENLNVFCYQFGVEIEWVDERYAHRVVDVEFNGTLRTEQQVAANALLSHDNGVLSATTAFGKTVVGASLIAERKQNTLILVHTRQLMEQWKARLNQFLIINEKLPEDSVKKRGRRKKRELIGQIGAGKNTLSGIVDIAIMQSAIKDYEVKEFIENYGMVIVDECHHVPAISFEHILKNVHAKYVYGLTATPIRKDGHHPIIFLQCGPVRYSVDAKKQAEIRPFQHYLIPRFTPFRLPYEWIEKEKTISEIYSKLVESEIRNQLIVNDVVRAVEEGRTPIVLTERTGHVEIIVDSLKGRVSNVITLTGKMSGKLRREALERLEGISEKDGFVIVATGRFIGEGFDEPRLDTLFLAMPVAWKGTIAQYAGRLHRLSDNKSEVIVYDYVDTHVSVLDRMYYKRLKGYAAIGYSLKNNGNLNESSHTIFDSGSFDQVFLKDLANAKSDIVIVSPVISNRRIMQLSHLLRNATNNGTRVCVVTQPESETKTNKNAYKRNLELLKNLGVDFVAIKGVHQRFAAIDDNIVWYGNMNLMSYGRSHANMMRLISPDIASELLDLLKGDK